MLKTQLELSIEIIEVIIKTNEDFGTNILQEESVKHLRTAVNYLKEYKQIEDR